MSIYSWDNCANLPGYGDNAYDDSWDEKPTEAQLAEQAENAYEYQCGLREDREYYSQYD